MGDRTYVAVTFSAADRTKIEAALGEPLTETFNEIEVDCGQLECIAFEANYAYFEEFKTLAAAGIVFTGSHAEGGNFGPGAFCGWGGKHSCVNADRDGRPVVVVHEDGEVDDKEMAHVREHITLMNLANDWIVAHREDAVLTPREAEADAIANYLDDVEPDWKDTGKTEFEERVILLTDLTLAKRRVLPSLAVVDLNMAGKSKTEGPILLDDDLSVIDGMHRIAAAIKSGQTTISAKIRRKP